MTGAEVKRAMRRRAAVERTVYHRMLRWVWRRCNDQEAKAWHKALGRPALSTRITLREDHARRLIQRTKWRRYHGLPTAEKVLATYCPRPSA